MIKKCPICGKELPEYQPCGKKFKSKTCSRSCGAILRSKETESNWKRKDVQAKAHFSAKETLLIKYGVDNPAKIGFVKEKIKKTNLEKYGVESILQTKEVKEKSKLSRQSAKALIKMSKNSKLRNVYPLGVLSAQSESSKQKRKSTCLEKYGTETPLENKVVRQKIQQTMSVKYPKGSVSRSLITQKSKEICLQHYGVELGFFANGYQSSGEAEVREFIQSLGFKGSQNNQVVPGI